MEDDRRKNRARDGKNSTEENAKNSTGQETSHISMGEAKDDSRDDDS